METRGEGYMVGFRATPPAEVLESELEYRGIPLEDFCIDARLDLDFLKEMIRGEHPVTPELAQKFEDILDIPASFWLKFQENYEYDKKVIAERAKQKKQQKKSEGFFETMGKVAVL